MFPRALCAVLFCGLIAPQPAHAQEDLRLPWWQRAREGQVGRYGIRTDLPAEQAEVLARHLNLMYRQFSVCLASVPARAPIPLEVLIFREQSEYVDTLLWRFGVDAGGTGGIFFVNPSGKALALWTGGRLDRRTLHALQHEGFHQFAYSRFGSDLPPWVDEGLAELFGEAVVVGGRLRVGAAPARLIEHTRDSIEQRTYVPFDRMVTMSRDEWAHAVKAPDAVDRYRQAWSMVHFLIYGGDRRYAPRFQKYLQLLHDGYLSADAFRRAFQTEDVEAFERRWKQHVLSLEPDAFATALDRIEFLAQGALELRRRGIFPGSLNQLRQQLQAGEFTTLLSFHEAATSQGADEAMFTIPADPDDSLPPAFVVKSDEATKRRDEGERLPPVIATENLEPRDLSVRWVTDEETGEVGYEIRIGGD